MAVQNIGDGGPDGTNFIQTGEKGAFFGATPVVRPTGTSQAACTKTTTTTSTTTALTTDLDAVRVLVNKLRTDLVALGLIKGSS